MPNKNYPKVHPEAKKKDLACGSCQWFGSGFEGKNCKNLRDVEVTTAACVEFTSYLPDLFHELLNDKYLAGIRNVLRSNRFKLDENSILDELKKYNIDPHLENYVYGSTQDLEATTMTLRKIISYRSRVSSIYTNLIDIQHDLDEILNQINLWVYSKYEIMRELKNEVMRKAAIDRLLPEVMGINKTLSKLMVTAKYIEEKLEANDRTLGKILSSSEKMWFNKEKPGLTHGTYGTGPGKN